MQGLTIVSVKLTPEAASAIFQTAIDAGLDGFSYWAALEDMTNEGDAITSITLRERDVPNRRRTIDAHALEVGLAKGLGEGTLDVCEEFSDGPTSEVILQYAMFGEQVYG